MGAACEISGMKRTIVSLAFMSVAFGACALDRVDLDQRIHTLLDKFQSMQQDPDKRVPARDLHRAQGVILLDRTKAGFLFAYEGGSGVALARDPKTGHWNPPAFLRADQASVGFLVGAERNFYVILLLTTNAERVLTDPTFEFGASASGTAGNSTSGTGVTVSDDKRAVLVFDNKRGLYGGAAVKGGAISPDNEANSIYYGNRYSMREILYDKKGQWTPTAKELVALIDANSQVPRSEEKKTETGQPGVEGVSKP
jgi:lipid-binding SYLF domain-containing protein